MAPDNDLKIWKNSIFSLFNVSYLSFCFGDSEGYLIVDNKVDRESTFGDYYEKNSKMVLSNASKPMKYHIDV